MKLRLMWVAALGAAVVVGCGGKAVVEVGKGAGGAGGSSSSSTDITSTSVSAPGDVGTGEVGTGEVGSQVGETVTATGVGTSTGPSTCDNQGECGDSSSGCIACSLEGLCGDIYNACVGDQGCIDYANCVQECGQNDMCQAQCADQDPGGAALYNKLILCVICDACASDCAGTVPCQG